MGTAIKSIPCGYCSSARQSPSGLTDGGYAHQRCARVGAWPVRDRGRARAPDPGAQLPLWCLPWTRTGTSSPVRVLLPISAPGAGRPLLQSGDVWAAECIRRLVERASWAIDSYHRVNPGSRSRDLTAKSTEIVEKDGGCPGDPSSCAMRMSGPDLLMDHAPYQGRRR